MTHGELCGGIERSTRLAKATSDAGDDTLAAARDVCYGGAGVNTYVNC
jgi:hypothetical protein